MGRRMQRGVGRTEPERVPADPESHVLEQQVRRVVLEQILSEAGKVVGAREILDVAEAFAWVTNPAQAHGGGA
jgi:hypothetical protein